MTGTINARGRQLVDVLVPAQKLQRWRPDTNGAASQPRQSQTSGNEEAFPVPLQHFMLKPWVKRYPTSAVKNPGFWKDVVLERIETGD